jgi:xanthine dehydrogenase accessory factor
MWIWPDASYRGTLSGGCLERDIARQAWPLTEAGPTVAIYDTRAEALLPSGRYGSGCEGVVQVLLQRWPDMTTPALRAALEPSAIDHVLVHPWNDSDQCAGRTGVWQRGEWLQRPSSWLSALDTAAAQIHRLRSSAYGSHGAQRYLIEWLPATPELVIVGSGQDAVALAELARPLGWDIRVYGHDRLKLQRFPNGVTTQLLSEPDSAVLSLSERSAVVVMTHVLEADLDILRNIIDSPVGYIGLLGPKQRTRRLLERWHAAGELPEPKHLDKLHSPTGLDLGAEDPHSVALSILAEIVAVRQGRSGGALRERTGSIHTPLPHIAL